MYVLEHFCLYLVAFNLCRYVWQAKKTQQQSVYLYQTQLFVHHTQCLIDPIVNAVFKKTVGSWHFGGKFRTAAYSCQHYTFCISLYAVHSIISRWHQRKADYRYSILSVFYLPHEVLRSESRWANSFGEGQWPSSSVVNFWFVNTLNWDLLFDPMHFISDWCLSCKYNILWICVRVEN